ncbi:MAG: nucleoside-diphosphate-sugar epimerase [Crocinitomicaceae bacterium]|jgi:nucleoside-diphosphate-sugar epimerase
MATVLIIGGSGCVGIETTHALLSRGVDTIICLSRGTTAIIPVQGVKYVQADILAPKSISAVLNEHAVTHVLHAAALRTTDCKNAPARAVELNVTGTTNVLEAIRLYGKIQRIVFTSTAAVYKVPDDGSFVDERATTIPLNPYTATKLAAEQLIECYALCYQIPATILRPQIIYGPTRGSDGSTAGISQAIKAAQEERHFTIPFGGRTGFHYSRDVGQQHAIALLESPEHFARYNLPAESLSIAELCSAINTHHGNQLVDYIDSPYPFAHGLDSSAFLQAFPQAQCTSFSDALNYE